MGTGFHDLAVTKSQKPHILAAYPNCSLFKENPAFQPFSWKCRVEESNQISIPVNSLGSKFQIVHNLATKLLNRTWFTQYLPDAKMRINAY